KNSVKTAIVMNGWSTAHDAPRTVCRYRTLRSRQIRKYSSSRYSQRSPSRTGAQPEVGRMSVTSTSAFEVIQQHPFERLAVPIQHHDTRKAIAIRVDSQEVSRRGAVHGTGIP